jgi:hypothetical protein
LFHSDYKTDKRVIKQANGNVVKNAFENQPVKRFVKFFAFFLWHAGTDFDAITA